MLFLLRYPTGKRYPLSDAEALGEINDPVSVGVVFKGAEYAKGPAFGKSGESFETVLDPLPRAERTSDHHEIHFLVKRESARQGDVDARTNRMNIGIPQGSKLSLR